jgi:hypothetical protein
VYLSLVAFNALILIGLTCFRRDRPAARVRLFRWVMRHQRPERRCYPAQSQFHT